MESRDEREVPMIHHECHACDMTATSVDTPSAGRAWADHMEEHGPTGLFSEWRWTIVPLPIDGPPAGYWLTVPLLRSSSDQ